MNDNDLITRREVELVLMEKGQKTGRHKWGEEWELNFREIREALSEYRPEIVQCKDCKHGSLYCTEDVCGETLIECNRPDLGDVIEIHEWKWFCADGKRR